MSLPKKMDQQTVNELRSISIDRQSQKNARGRVELDEWLLDTNIAIALLGSEHAALEFVRQARDDRMSIYFSVITKREVFSGLDSEFRLQGIKLFNPRRCIEVSFSVARLAKDIRREQRSKGRKLKTPDAIILQHLSSISSVLYQEIMT